MDNNQWKNQGQQPQNQGGWQQPPNGMPQNNGSWQQRPNGMPQNNGSWQQPRPPYNGGWQQPPRPPKKSRVGLIVGIIIAVIVLIAAGVCAYGYFALGWFGNGFAASSAGSSVSEEERMRQYEAEQASRAAEEEAKRIAEASRDEERKRENRESYERLREQWDEASRKQQEQAEEIMRNYRQGSSAAATPSGSAAGGTVVNTGIKVSGTWYSPVNQHTGDQSMVTFESDGTVTLTVDMGASELITRFGTYSAVKNGPYEYDDIVCHVSLTPGSGSMPNSFTFVIDPEVDNGKYAVFKESGFGMIQAGTTFTQKV